MTTVWPLKFRELPSGDIVFADDAGGFFRSDRDFLDRYASDALTPADQSFLLKGGHAYQRPEDVHFTSFAYRWAQRLSTSGALSYVIVVPTLRCNLTCDYCQVSRASENARGVDWTDETVEQVLSFLDGLSTDAIKIEFQGGEPMLRLDLLERVRSFARSRFSRAEFVVCTNLQRFGPAERAFLEASDTAISTSIDGDRATHRRQRTKSGQATGDFFDNLTAALAGAAPGKISALPTIDIDHPPAIDDLIDAYVGRGLTSIYLRPISYHGFGRKRRAGGEELARWNAYHAAFIERLIERNARDGTFIEEFYFSQCLKRILRPGHDGHVDLRNPNILGDSYVVIDFDGAIYPTDEARMLARIGRVDLSVGHVSAGIDRATLAQLNLHAFNNFDPDCIHCPYQAFCGTDLIDDLARYGRIDHPKRETWFCGRQTALFDLAFDVLYRTDDASRRSVATWIGVPEWTPHAAPVHR